MLYIYKMVNGNYLASTKKEKVTEVTSIDIPYKTIAGLYNRVYTSGEDIWLRIKGEFSPDNLNKLLEIAVLEKSTFEKSEYILMREEKPSLVLKASNLRDLSFTKAIYCPAGISNLGAMLESYRREQTYYYDIDLDTLLDLVDGTVCPIEQVPYVSRATGVTLVDYEDGKAFYIIEKGDSFHVTSKVLGSFNTRSAVALLKKLGLPENGVLDKKQLGKLKSKTNYKEF